MSDGFNEIPYSEVLPILFEKKEHFSKEEYYNEMISICLELKKKWYEKIPSEEKIQKMIIEELRHAVVDGKQSVPLAEKALGIKIDAGYTYPRGMNDFEYNMECFYKYGLFSYFQKSDKGRERCFDCRSDANGHYARKPDKKRAYQQAWINLHYPDREAVKKSMQNDWNEICELNPELKEVKFDKENIALLRMAQAGVTYGFPKEDIELFLNEYGKGSRRIGFEHTDRIKAELKEAGLPEDFSPEWVPSSQTIKKMGELYKIAQQEKAKEQQREKSQEKQPESTQDIVAQFRAGGGIKVIDKGVLNRPLDGHQMENKATQILTAFNRQKGHSV